MKYDSHRDISNLVGSFCEECSTVWLIRAIRSLDPRLFFDVVEVIDYVATD